MLEYGLIITKLILKNELKTLFNGKGKKAPAPHEGFTAVMDIGENNSYNISRLMSTSFVIMILTHTLVHAAGNMRGTLFPVLKEEFSLTNQKIGLIIAIPSLCQFLVTVPVLRYRFRILPVGTRIQRGLPGGIRFQNHRIDRQIHLIEIQIRIAF